jgi:hypothetical protein
LLAEHADFHVNINSVVGGGIRNPQDALVVGKRAVELGFTSTVGIIHDGDRPVAAAVRAGARSLRGHARHGEKQLRAHQLFPGQHRARQREPLAMPRRRALSVHLRRRAGALLFAAARLSGQAAGEYTVADIRREYRTEKSCAPRCTVACVHQIPTSISGARRRPWTAANLGRSRLLGGQSRLKAGCGQNCPPHKTRLTHHRSAFPQSRQADLWSGVGLACAYAGGVDRRRLEFLREAAGPYLAQAAQGAAFAAKARARAGNPAHQTDLACGVFCGIRRMRRRR